MPACRQLPSSGRLLQAVVRAVRLPTLVRNTPYAAALQHRSTQEYLAGRRRMRAACCARSAVLGPLLAVFGRDVTSQLPTIRPLIGPAFSAALDLWDQLVVPADPTPRAAVRFAATDIAFRLAFVRRLLGRTTPIDEGVPAWSCVRDPYVRERLVAVGANAARVKELMPSHRNEVDGWLNGGKHPTLAATRELANAMESLGVRCGGLDGELWVHFALRYLFRLLAEGVGDEVAREAIVTAIRITNHWSCEANATAPDSLTLRAILGGGFVWPAGRLLRGCSSHLELPSGWTDDVQRVEECARDAERRAKVLKKLAKRRHLRSAQGRSRSVLV